MKKENCILIAGATGLVGSALYRKLMAENYTNVLTPNRQELNLLDQSKVNRYFKEHSIEYVFVAAAKVGGIHANSTYPADFIYENLVIATNLIHAASEFGVKKLLYLGSSCIYPKDCHQPMREEDLLSGPLEFSNEAYAIAKIAGLKLCKHFRTQYGKDFIAAMPTNLYGPNDNFHPLNSHVLPALLRRFHEAKEQNLKKVDVWGSGRPIRELLFVDDLADALLVVMKKYSSNEIINIGTGRGLSTGDLARLVKDIVGYNGKIEFDLSKPDGTPRKVLDITKITNLGWKPLVSLEEGIRRTYHWAINNQVFNEKLIQRAKNKKRSNLAQL